MSDVRARGSARDRGRQQGVESPYPGLVFGAHDRARDLSPAHVCHPAGTRSLGTSAPRVTLVRREARADAGRSTAPLAWPKCGPAGGGRIPRRTGHACSAPLCGGALKPTGAAARPGLWGCPSAGSRGRGRPYEFIPLYGMSSVVASPKTGSACGRRESVIS